MFRVSIISTQALNLSLENDSRRANCFNSELAKQKDQLKNKTSCIAPCSAVAVEKACKDFHIWSVAIFQTACMPRAMQASVRGSGNSPPISMRIKSRILQARFYDQFQNP
jgi:hypothetical protein